MKSVLLRPVEFVDLRLAPTSELAGLAELALLDDPDELVAVLGRIARTLQAEDAERARIAGLRRRAEPVALPRRKAG